MLIPKGKLRLALFLPHSVDAMPKQIKRICIVGCSGSGKSTLARKLGRQTGIPVKHLDKLYWKPGWVEIDQDTFRKAVSSELAFDDWIIDGNFGATAGERFRRCHLIIHLNYSTWSCLVGVLKRIVTTYGKVRPDMGEGCPERLDWSFLKWVLAFNKPGSSRDKLLEQVQKYGQHCALIQPKNRRQLRNAMKQVLPRIGIPPSS